MLKKILNPREAREHSYTKRSTFSESAFKTSNKVLLKNLKLKDQKDGWALKPWLRPYTIYKIHSNKLCMLKYENKILKTKQLITNIKKYYQPISDNSIYDESNQNLPIDYTRVITQEEISNQEFFSVTIIRQKNKWKQFKFKLHQYKENCEQQKPLTVPIKIQQVVGDGNCLFRASTG